MNIYATTNQEDNMDSIPTYYAELISRKHEEVRHLKARWNQMHTMRNNALCAGNAERAEEIKALMIENFLIRQSLQEKIESWQNK